MRMESYLSELVIGDRGNRFNHEKSEDTRALTEYERKQFIYQLVRAHFTGKICEKTYLILKLIFITGKRAEQLANTKLCDFKNGFINIDGTPKKVIPYNCPIAKQKFQTFRVEFNEIPLSWELDFDKDISAVADRSITLTEKLLGPLTLEQKKHVPLFCIERPTQVLRSEISRHSINTVLDGKFYNNRAGVGKNKQCF